MKYFIKTFGCQMNTSDSERIAAFLEQQGYSAATKISEADLAIFNTCGIKQTAENRAYSMINNLRKSASWRKKQSNRIIMTGCLANRPDVQKRMKKSVDLFCEIKNFQTSFNDFINCHPELVSGSSVSKKPTEILKQIQHDTGYLSIIPKHTNSFTAYVPIMTGCNNFCSYCVVPYARGREVSRPVDEVIDEVRSLIKKDFKNIVLLGQNVNSYRGAFGKKDATVGFSELIKKIDKIPGKFWLSFVSSHPKDMSDELIETVAKSKKMCEWVHLPLQAGNNEVLKGMNRHYTKEHYSKLIRKIRSEFRKHKPASALSISSDIIVGFPGETKLQFADSEMMMKKSKFDMVFFGQFSPRPGTKAWEMKDNVSHEEKERRENVLNDILKKTTLANNKKYVGQKLEVLIEKEKDGFYFGKTRTQKNVKIQTSKKDLVGKFTRVEISKANIWNLEGILK